MPKIGGTQSWSSAAAGAAPKVVVPNNKAPSAADLNANDRKLPMLSPKTSERLQDQ
ncbi:hypothetical protein NtRootA4_32710 [Arthrobacter sp. NtRootA4]|nr:hypothetical protein NtRootA2_34920 [Arthrobacter sp. NtRootA2]BCW16292.1 hypothetical protein NtRootA4_32710 [Arthrobacter sp. NtRootA4]BCW24624.1 hypothetical protein NtRootC7_34910 [Arthrobacter sp. NtRootC7]BCW28895.1 hypothetical protein NtRootC45_34950 [Arthrobacter sp. NtRootC45]BCW33165.1 hypothetical protein NtRootD5_34960 [Arthrobacter sp. NtRootD5]